MNSAKNHSNAPKVVRKQPRTLIREINELLKADGLRVVDWGRDEINPPPQDKRYFLETVDSDDWDLVEDLRALHEELCVKHSQNTPTSG